MIEKFNLAHFLARRESESCESFGKLNSWIVDYTDLVHAKNVLEFATSHSSAKRAVKDTIFS